MMETNVRDVEIKELQETWLQKYVNEGVANGDIGCSNALDHATAMSRASRRHASRAREADYTPPQNCIWQPSRNPNFANLWSLF